MNYFKVLLFLLFSATSFAQNTGAVVGLLFDGESSNEPLLFAKISVKGTATEATSNEYGQFNFESLANGSYTFVFEFVGYESQELQVDVQSGNVTELNVTLNASTFDLSDLALVTEATSLKNKDIQSEFVLN